MTMLFRAARFLSPFLLLPIAIPPALAQEPVTVQPMLGPVLTPAAPTLPAPTTLKPDDPWIYRGTDIPQDAGWHFGELPNGLRYAVRTNLVPAGQVSIRIRVDAGSLNETDSERGYAHLIEHLVFRESKYLANGQAIPTWQRLGARLGADTNAMTSPTQTVFQLDLPDGVTPKLDESMKLLSGMVREPALSKANITTEVPIVLAEKRDSGGPGRRISDATSALFFKDQPLASRTPIGTDATLTAATSDAIKAFHQRWYRPENTVIVIAGEGAYQDFAALIERWFGDWKPAGQHVPAPDFGAPKAPAGADPANPVGETEVHVEPDLPRSIAVGILRPWGKPTDNLEYNRELMLDRVGRAIVNRRLESRARAGGSYVIASVDQQELSRSNNATFINITPIGPDWKTALKDARAVIADALATAPSEEEIAREVSEMDVVFANDYEQRINQLGSQLADSIVGAVDIRESVASPETFLTVLRDMRGRFTPQAVLDHTRKLFQGTVIRGFLLTPDPAEADDGPALRQALLEPVEADGSSRTAAQDVSFDKLPPIGTPHEPVSRKPLGVLDIEQLDYGNGVKALLWRTENEPGRVSVRVRFGSGYRGFSQEDAPYISLGQGGLVYSGVGPLGAAELDAISAGRKLGFNFSIDDGVFRFGAETRKEDLADQLYLFAAKLSQPRWDERPIERIKALTNLGYPSLNSDPMSVIGRDLEWVLDNRDARFATPTPEQLAATTPEGFRKAWEPLLKQGPIEVIVFGDIDKAAAEAALARTFGALPQREPIPDEALARTMTFSPVPPEPVVLYHHGDEDQAAAAVAWPLGGGIEGLSLSRKLSVLNEIFNNRMLDALRETEGASYTPDVSMSWPTDVNSGGRMLAIAQLKPEAVPQFFAIADAIATDLAANGPTPDEIARVTEPNYQLLSRSESSHVFWMNQVEGATTNAARLEALGTLLTDYTVATPEGIRDLARQYLPAGKGLRVAVIPLGQSLATKSAPLAAGVGGPPAVQPVNFSEGR